MMTQTWICSALTRQATRPHSRLVARNALRQAGHLAARRDPVSLGIELGFSPIPVVWADERASLDGRFIPFLWLPDDELEANLNCFLGLGKGVCERAGYRPGDAQIVHVAAHLAIPDPNAEYDEDIVPTWFRTARCRMSSGGSGVWNSPLRVVRQ
jgi:hypothetical protein